MKCIECGGVALDVTSIYDERYNYECFDCGHKWEGGEIPQAIKDHEMAIMNRMRLEIRDER
jgi:hypothetical protein